MNINTITNYQTRYNRHYAAKQNVKSAFETQLTENTATTPKTNSAVPTEEQVAALLEKQSKLVNTRWGLSEDYKVGVTYEIEYPDFMKKLMAIPFDEKVALGIQYKAESLDAAKNAPPANTSLKWYGGDTMSFSEAQKRMDGAIVVRIGKNELPKLMEEIEKVLADGESYLTAIEKFYDNKGVYVGAEGFDKIFIDPYTGDVKHAAPCGAAYNSAKGKVLHSMGDDDAVWDLAYDLQEFLKLRVFGETDGMSKDEAEKAIADIKARQADKNTYRFGSDSAHSDWERLMSGTVAFKAEKQTPILQSAPKTDPALVDALIAAEKAAKKARWEQRVKIIPNLVLGQDLRAQFEANAAAEAAKKNVPEPNASLKWYGGTTISNSDVAAKTAGTVSVTVGKDQLLSLMNNIEKALANGKCYLTAVLDLYNSQYHGIGGSYDTFSLDPYTGGVKHAVPCGSIYTGQGEQPNVMEIAHSAQTDDAVWDLAYDLQQFLKLRVFGETDGMSKDEVEKAIADIKARQADKDTWRFDSRPPAPAVNNAYGELAKLMSV